METVSTDRAPAALGPYAQAVRHRDLVFVSGQIALNAATGRLEGADAATQARRVLANIEAVLSAAGSGLDRVLKTTVYLRDMADFDAVNEVYARAFPGRPARATVAVAGLPAGALVEIECVAVSGGA